MHENLNIEWKEVSRDKDGSWEYKQVMYLGQKVVQDNHDSVHHERWQAGVKVAVRVRRWRVVW